MSPKIQILISATFDLGENYNAKQQVFCEAHILNDKHISAHTISDCCVPYINKKKSGTAVPVTETEVGKCCESYFCV
jgi:hypothetical protein